MMRKKTAVRSAALTMLLLLTGASSVIAAPKNDPSHSTQTGIAEAIFTEMERRIICDHYKIPACGTESVLGQTQKDHKGKVKGHVGSKDKTAMLPPGLARRDELPPGLERQYQRNGTLPPGLQKRQLPDDLARALPRRSRDFERVVVGNDVLLIAVATGVILDIMEGVAAGR